SDRPEYPNRPDPAEDLRCSAGLCSAFDRRFYPCGTTQFSTRVPVVEGRLARSDEPLHLTACHHRHGPASSSRDRNQDHLYHPGETGPTLGILVRQTGEYHPPPRSEPCHYECAFPCRPLSARTNRAG